MASAWYLLSLSHAYRMVGQYEKAMEFVKKPVQRSLNNLFAHSALAQA